MTPSEKNVELPILFHLRWITKIVLSVGALAGLVLFLVLFKITDSKAAEYGSTILSSNLTRQNFGPAILLFGLAMTVIACVVTWLISLYSSFRIAGPVFRFSQNLKSAIEHPLAVPVPIRQTDMLQREWKEFETSLTKLDEHYRSLSDALDRVKQTLSAEAETDPSAVRRTVAQLREIERLVQL